MKYTNRYGNNLNVFISTTQARIRLLYWIQSIASLIYLKNKLHVKKSRNMNVIGRGIKSCEAQSAS